MAQGLFVHGFTLAEVLAIQKVAKANLLAGVQQTSWSLGESSSGSVPAMTTMQVLDECQFALKKLDPKTYPSRNRVYANFSHGPRGRDLPRQCEPECAPVNPCPPANPAGGVVEE